MLIKKTKLDTLTYNVTKENYKTSFDRIEELAKDCNVEYVEDIYHGLFKFNPEYEETNTRLSTALKEAFDTKEWKGIHDMCKGNIYNSTLSTIAMGDEFFSTIPENVKREENLEKQLINIDEAIDCLDDEGYDTTQMKALKGSIVKKLNKVKKLNDGYDYEDAIRQAIKVISERMKEEVEKGNDALGLNFGDNPEKPKTIKESLRAYDRIKTNKKVLKIAKFLGCMRDIYNSWNKKKINRQPDEIVDVETGRNLSSMLPSQKLMLAIPQTELMFYRGYNNGCLLQYKKTGKSPVGKGDIIYCEDQSISMSVLDRIEWAKAIGCMLMIIAKNDRRNIDIHGFSNNVTSNAYKPDEIDEKSIQDYMQRFLNGGTNYENVLKRLMESDYKDKSDIIFLTDEEYEFKSRTVLEEFLKFKKARNINVIGIQLHDESITTVGCLSEFCDNVFQFNKADPNDVKLENIFAI